MDSKRLLYVDAIRSVIGRPYIWGGQNKSGFDCSGLVIWAMNKAGITLEDMTSAELANYYHRFKILPSLAKPGCLMFYGDGMTHVMTVLDVWTDNNTSWPYMTVVGARGGDETVKNYDMAAEQEAFVDVQFGEYWKYGFMVMVDPFRR